MGGKLVKVLTLKEAAELLDAKARERASKGLERGRSLVAGYQWTGQDVPGRGSAVKRRLRQIAKGQIAPDQIRGEASS
jgi:hypothetical protein